MAVEERVCRVIGERRVRPEKVQGAGRPLGMDEAEPTLTREQAIAEARRCTAASPCLYCDVCQLLCPDLAITRDPETGEIEKDLDYCKGCGLCAHFCPHGAIRMIVDE